MSKQKKKSKSNSIQNILIAAAVAFAVTLLLSNLTALTVLFGGAEKKELSISNISGDDTVTISKDDPLEFTNVNMKMKSVCLTTAGDEMFYTDVTASFTDDNFRYDDAFNYNTARQSIAVGDGCRSVIMLSSFGDVGTLRISCDDTIEVKSVTLNAAPAFSFHLLLYIAVFGVICTVMFKIYDDFFDKEYYYIKIFGAALCVLILVITSVIHNMCDEPLLMAIPEDVTKEDQYTQLFDAFHKGQTNLDIDYDMSKLEALENPYDRSERNEYDLHGAFWDRAYYNGKLYSYFGTAPIFTVYGPIYILTKKIPTPLMASSLLCVYAVIFLTLLYELLLKKLCKSVPRELSLLGLTALVFGSALPAVASETQFYFIAVLSGVGSAAAFLYFLLAAYYEKQSVRRLILLALAGVSTALIAASRPTLLLYCFVAIVPAAYIFKDKALKLKDKIACTAAIGVPIIIGAALIMAYNNARFGSPMEFGFNYQLTVSRAQANTFKLSMIMPMIYHYFFQTPQYSSSFPYINPRTYGLESYTRYNYSGMMMGVFSYPVSWGLAALPFTLTKKESFKRQLLLSLTGAAVLMAFIDMCKAGSHYRYTADILFILLLVALIAVFDVMAKIRTHSEKSYRIFYALTAAVMAATIILGGLLAAANEGGTMLGDYAAATEFLRTLL